MPEPDAFDPTHALDGWRPPAPAPVQELDLDKLLHPGPQHAQPLLAHAGASGFDPTHLLDGWRPPAPPPFDLELKCLQRAGQGPDEATLARLKARGYEMLDVEDIELVETPPTPRVFAWIPEAPPAPPLAEAEPAPPPSSEDAAQAEGAVDLALPDEAVWPLFMAEAQPLTEPEPEPLSTRPAPFAGPELNLPVAEPEAELPPADAQEPAPAVIADAPGAPLTAELPAVEAEVWPEPAPSALAQAPTMEVQIAEPEPAAADVGGDMEAVAPQFEAPAAAALAEAPAPEPELEPVVEPALLDEDAESLAGVAAAEAPGPEPAEPAPLVADELPVPEVDDFVAEAALPEPPIEPPPPRFTDQIQLPPVPPPPAVFEAPVLDFRVAPPPDPDLESVIAGIELPRVTPPPASIELPELDIAALTPQAPEGDPRLLAHWQAGAWTALARQVAAASEELWQTPAGLRVESQAPQWLCAVWPPHAEDAPLGRWPELAAVVTGETTVDALQQLLAELPAEAPLWSAGLDADWDLVAELVLHQDTGLRPSQARALREFAEAEREARLLHFSEGYALQGHVARRRA